MAQIVSVGLIANGGFVPQYKTCSVNLAVLSPDDAAALVGLVHASGILNYPDGSAFKVRGAADTIDYSFIVKMDDDKKARTVTFDNPSLPNEVQPLLRYLLARSENLLDT
jgi:hypothetical protein